MKTILHINGMMCSMCESHINVAPTYENATAILNKMNRPEKSIPLFDVLTILSSCCKVTLLP